MVIARAKPAVWVVEDSALEARAACQALANDFACDVFGAGSAVIERLAAASPPSVLLLDWELPDMSGVEVCRFVRTMCDELSLPIILVTSHSDSANVVEGLTAGANDFVSKPYSAEILAARVKSLARTQQVHHRRLEVEAQLATTLRSIGDAVISTDVHGAVRFLNASASELIGTPPADALGAPLGEVFHILHDTTRERIESPVDRVLRDDTSLAVTHHRILVRRDGSEVPIDESASPIRDSAGRVIGVVLVFRDTSEKRRVDAEREALLARANAAQAELTNRAEFERQLIGIVSHDLRTPLSTILLGTQVLIASRGADDKSLKSLGRIQSAAERGARMVSDLLDFTQARLNGSLPISLAPGDLHAVVRQSIEDMSPTFTGRDVRITTSGDGDGLWDQDRMAQVILNLVSNALKYSPPASAVEVRSDGDPDGVTVSVHNIGTPIAADALARIFSPMQRATTQLENKARSVGLGLFIVRHLVEAHGGRISVSSTAEAGTTFSFRVPKRPVG